MERRYGGSVRVIGTVRAIAPVENAVLVADEEAPHLRAVTHRLIFEMHEARRHIDARPGNAPGADGINIVAGTGSIAYGEYSGRGARAGGWGELFSDEGSAYWLAREGLRLFSRMSDGRAARGALYEGVRRHFALADDLELCAAIYGKSVAQRSQLAQLAKLVADAARAGDQAAQALFAQEVTELAEMVDAVRTQLHVPPGLALPVSYSGGLFQLRDLLLAPLAAALAARAHPYRFLPARLPPDGGAALQAAKLCGTPLDARSITTLEAEVRIPSPAGQAP